MQINVFEYPLPHRFSGSIIRCRDVRSKFHENPSDGSNAIRRDRHTGEWMGSRTQGHKDKDEFVLLETNQ